MAEETAKRDVLANAIGMALLHKGSTNGEITTEGLGRALFDLVGDDKMVELISEGFGDRCVAELKLLTKPKKVRCNTIRTLRPLHR